MKNLSDPIVASEIKDRATTLTARSARIWGTMTPAQALAHCSAGIDMALGRNCPPRMWIGRLLGPFIKPIALRADEPMRRNAATVEGLAVNDERDLDMERTRLFASIDLFVAGGPAACTTHPHAFFGTLTPDEWSILMYKHLDHHLRQFGA